MSFQLKYCLWHKVEHKPKHAWNEVAINKVSNARLQILKLGEAIATVRIRTRIYRIYINIYIYIYIFTVEMHETERSDLFPSARLNDWGCSTGLLKVFSLETFCTTFWVFSIPRSKRKALCFFSRRKSPFQHSASELWSLLHKLQLCFSPFPSAMLFVLKNGMEFLGTKRASCFNKHVVWQISRNSSYLPAEGRPRMSDWDGTLKSQGKNGLAQSNLSRRIKENSLCLPNCLLW